MTSTRQVPSQVYSSGDGQDGHKYGGAPVAMLSTREKILVTQASLHSRCDHALFLVTRLVSSDLIYRRPLQLPPR